MSAENVGFCRKSPALNNQLQTSINLALGSAVATIGLIVPGVAVVAWWTNKPAALGVRSSGAVILTLFFMMAHNTLR